MCAFLPEDNSLVENPLKQLDFSMLAERYTSVVLKLLSSTCISFQRWPYSIDNMWSQSYLRGPSVWPSNQQSDKCQTSTSKVYTIESKWEIKQQNNLGVSVIVRECVIKFHHSNLYTAGFHFAKIQITITYQVISFPFKPSIAGTCARSACP